MVIIHIPIFVLLVHVLDTIFGMVMIEAMACGTPVAGIDCPGGPADVIINGEDGILTSVEKYAIEVVKFFKDENIRKQMSKNAREKAVRDFSIDATTQVLRKSVESALK